MAHSSTDYFVPYIWIYKIKQMPRRPHSHHYIYKTTCNVNGKFYIGMHSTSNLEDGYLGSGKILKRSLNRYGIENHTKEILEFLPNRISLKEREMNLVNEDLLHDPLCMNLKTGGEGGFNRESCIKGGINSSKVFKEKIKSDLEFRNSIHKQRSETSKKNWESEEYRRKIEKSLFKPGTCWIYNHNLKKTIKIKKEYLDNYINEGWIKGRKLCYLNIKVKDI